MVSLTYDTTVCNAFHLDFTRRDRAACDSQTRAALDDALDEEIKSQLGPDTIRIQLDGAERLSVQVPTSFSVETCSYRYTFRLANSGRVWVSAILLYEVMWFGAMGSLV